MWFGSGLILQYIQIWVYDAFGINLPIPTSSIIYLLLQKFHPPPSPSHLLSICGYPDCTVDCKMCFSAAEGSCHGCADVVSAPTLLHGVPFTVPSAHQLLCTSRLPLVVMVQCPSWGELLACCTRQPVRCKKKNVCSFRCDVSCWGGLKKINMLWIESITNWKSSGDLNTSTDSSLSHSQSSYSAKQITHHLWCFKSLLPQLLFRNISGW